MLFPLSWWSFCPWALTVPPRLMPAPSPHRCTQLMADSRLQMEELRDCLGSIPWRLACLVATGQEALYVGVEVSFPALGIV